LSLVNTCRSRSAGPRTTPGSQSRWAPAETPTTTPSARRSSPPSRESSSTVAPGRRGPSCSVRVRVHRSVLQPPAPALHPEHALANQLRTATTLSAGQLRATARTSKINDNNNTNGVTQTGAGPVVPVVDARGEPIATHPVRKEQCRSGQNGGASSLLCQQSTRAGASHHVGARGPRRSDESLLEADAPASRRVRLHTQMPLSRVTDRRLLHRLAKRSSDRREVRHRCSSSETALGVSSNRVSTGSSFGGRSATPPAPRWRLCHASSSSAGPVTAFVTYRQRARPTLRVSDDSL